MLSVLHMKQYAEIISNSFMTYLETVPFTSLEKEQGVQTTITIFFYFLSVLIKLSATLKAQ